MDRNNLIPRVLKRLEKRILAGEICWEDIENDFNEEKSIGSMCSQYGFSRTEIKVLKDYYYGRR